VAEGVRIDSSSEQDGIDEGEQSGSEVPASEGIYADGCRWVYFLR